MTKSDAAILASINRHDVHLRLTRQTEREGHGGCWKWIGYTEPQFGYGKIRLPGLASVSVHRFTFCAAAGRLPIGGIVRHTCDNPWCVNPEHLIDGTDADNARDRDTRGRQRTPRGTAHKLAKLSDDDVRAIRAEYAAGGIGFKRLGAKWGVAESLARRIVIRESWAHVL